MNLFMYLLLYLRNLSTITYLIIYETIRLRILYMLDYCIVSFFADFFGCEQVNNGIR